RTGGVTAPDPGCSLARLQLAPTASGAELFVALDSPTACGSSEETVSKLLEEILNVNPAIGSDHYGSTDRSRLRTTVSASAGAGGLGTRRPSRSFPARVRGTTGLASVRLCNAHGGRRSPT